MRYLSLLLILSLPVSAQTIRGKIVSIADGDTVTLLDAQQVQHKIRLSGIDAPEKRQAFGDKSKAALSECAFGKMADVEANKKDRYGRWVGKVIVMNKDCNLRQIELGLAWHYKQYEREQDVDDRSIYADAEYRAQIEKVGLWSEAGQTPPWKFRKQTR